MIPKVTCDITSHAASFGAKSAKAKHGHGDEAEAELLPSTIGNRMLAGFHRTTSAFIEYAPKGLAGDVNSNFYEFLAMGRIPYLVGSATFIGVFNGLSKYFDQRGAHQASNAGLKFATGVVLYALAKTLSKDLISRPVAWATGIDIEQPYKNVIYPFPKVSGKAPLKPGDKRFEAPDVQYQYQKLWESKEFPRIDVVDDEFFDEVARKNGLGTDLRCAECEVKPILRNVISTATTAQRVSSFLWAACGVALAASGDWDKFYNEHIKSSKLGAFVPDKGKSWQENAIDKTKHIANNSKEALKALKDTIVESSKELVYGPAGATGFKKHVGKGLLGVALASTIFGVANTITRARAVAKGLCNESIIDNSKNSQVV